MKMFVYVIDSDVCGIVLAADQKEAVKKVMDAYIDHGGPEFDPECVNIKIIPFEENSKFEDHPDVTELPEIFQGIEELRNIDDSKI